MPGGIMLPWLPCQKKLKAILICAEQHRLHLTLSCKKTQKKNNLLLLFLLLIYVNSALVLVLVFPPVVRRVMEQETFPTKEMLLFSTLTIAHEKSMWGALKRVVLLIFHRHRSVNLSMAASGEAGALKEAPWVYSRSDGVLKSKMSSA